LSAKRKSDEIEIREIERRLFLYLYESKVATNQQIRRDIYPHLTKKAITNRLSRLMKHRYVVGERKGSVLGRLVYSLGKRAYGEYIKPLGASPRKELSSAFVSHDLNLVDVRWHLQASRIVKNYFTENAVKSGEVVPFLKHSDAFGELQPDAIVEMELAGDTFRLPLEYEASQKFHFRYDNLFRRYYDSGSIPAVLYVCANSSLLNYVRSIEKRPSNEERFKFYYSDYSDWDGAQNIAFHNKTGDQIVFPTL